MLYLLRQFEQCADLLSAALDAQPDLPGARRLRGLALGSLGLSADAVRSLRAALIESPGDSELLGSLISAEIRAGLVPERPSVPAAGAAAELAGAGAWVRGREALREERMVAAAHAFQEAGDLFVQHSPIDTAPERAAAAYVGETVSWLAAGQFDAAQRGFSRLSTRVRLPEATLRFARGLYELADALRDLEPSERAEELAPLVDAIASARIRLRFYDGTAPVEMYWENLP
jgi:tetratricopeptide (TPR) repeat protein